MKLFTTTFTALCFLTIIAVWNIDSVNTSDKVIVSIVFSIFSLFFLMAGKSPKVAVKQQPTNTDEEILLNWKKDRINSLFNL